MADCRPGLRGRRTQTGAADAERQNGGEQEGWAHGWRRRDGRQIAADPAR
jgi:hypothetical protein